MRRPSHTFTVFRKELRETLRDRRTLFVMVLLPLVIYPLLAVVTSEWIITHETKRQAARSNLVLGGDLDGASEIVALFEHEDARLAVTRRLEWIDEEHCRRLVNGGVDAVLIFPPRYVENMKQGFSPDARICFDGADDDSKLARQRVEETLDKAAKAIWTQHLVEKGANPLVLEPPKIVEVNTATRAKLGRAEVGKTLPLIIVMMVMMGAFYPAIDLTAGEKERGTLEALLATPAPRRALVTGKFLTVGTIAFITGILNVLCVGAAIVWIARSALRAQGKSLALGEIASAVPWDAVVMGLVALAITSALFAGLTMAVAALARNFKEGQSYLVPVHIGVAIPAMVSSLPGTQLDVWTALVPVANVALLLKEAISGTLVLGTASIALAASVVYAAAALALASRIYDSERLLFAPEDARKKRGLLELIRGVAASRRPRGEGSEPPPRS